MAIEYIMEKIGTTILDDLKVLLIDLGDYGGFMENEKSLIKEVLSLLLTERKKELRRNILANMAVITLKIEYGLAV